MAVGMCFLFSVDDNACFLFFIMRFYCECKSFSFAAILALPMTLSNQKISKIYQRDRHAAAHPCALCGGVLWAMQDRESFQKLGDMTCKNALWVIPA
jgi:hypothetical protein